jgi:hypothetical protein
MRLKKISPVMPRPGVPSRQASGNADTDSPACEVDEDSAMQAALLNHVLDEHPMQLRQCDLVRELCLNPSDYAERDVVDRAIQVLVKVGLLDRSGKYVLPTPPARHFYQLPRL